MCGTAFNYRREEISLTRAENLDLLQPFTGSGAEYINPGIRTPHMAVTTARKIRENLTRFVTHEDENG